MIADDWEPIRRVNAKALGEDPNAADLMRIHVVLNRQPEREWAELFRPQRGVDWSVGMHGPELQHDVVRLRAPDEEVTHYINRLDEWIDVVNTRYRERVIPAQEAEREEAQAEARRKNDRILAAQEQIEQLGGNDPGAPEPPNTSRDW